MECASGSPRRWRAVMGMVCGPRCAGSLAGGAGHAACQMNTQNKPDTERARTRELSAPSCPFRPKSCCPALYLTQFACSMLNIIPLHGDIRFYFHPRPGRRVASGQRCVSGVSCIAARSTDQTGRGATQKFALLTGTADSNRHAILSRRTTVPLLLYYFTTLYTPFLFSLFCEFLLRVSSVTLVTPLSHIHHMTHKPNSHSTKKEERVTPDTEIAISQPRTLQISP